MIEQSVFVVGLYELFLFAVKREFQCGAFGFGVLQEGDFRVVLRDFAPAEEFETHEFGVEVY